MIWGIEQRVDLGDGHPLVRLCHFNDFVTSAHPAFPQDAEVEARPSARCQQGRHPRLIGPNANSIACHTRLRDLEQDAADFKAIADANGIVRQSFNGEVLSKLPVGEVGPTQLLRPVTVGFDLVDEDSSLLPPVAAKIGLTIAIQIQSPNPAATVDRTFPDRGSHRSALPQDIARKAYVH
jgi:hypothetical protein